MSGELTDRLEIINGPEDGVVFPIIRSPVDIGANPNCGIFVTFDSGMKPAHARVNVVSGGYRVRALSSAPVYVDDRRSGMVWARTVRSGQTIKVGNTEFCLLCEPDGLASRSLGLPTDTNLVWLLRIVFLWTCAILLYPFNLVSSLFARRPRVYFRLRFRSILMFIGIALLVVRFFWPGYLTLLFFWLRAQLRL